MNNYQEFLKSKKQRPIYRGFDVDGRDINPVLYPFQNTIVRWALKLGKAALFEAVGLGKTLQYLEWSIHVIRHTQKPVLIVAPLAVALQTMMKEAPKWGYNISLVKAEAEILHLQIEGQSLFITNYESLHKVDTSIFGGVVLDESSILKNITGKMRNKLVNQFKNTPFKLTCTATPAPNDYIELLNHSEFLDVKSVAGAVAMFFSSNKAIKKGTNWELKSWADDGAFWDWIATWAICIAKPRDMGDEYHIDGYDLPALHKIYRYVGTSQETIARVQKQGLLFPDTKPSGTDLHRLKRETLQARCEEVIAILEEIPSDESVIVWCDRNDESQLLAKLIGGDAYEVTGSQSDEIKAERLMAFANGEKRILITKASIAGMGMNFQHCAYNIKVGLNYSYEEYHQLIGRTHRYGQKREVYVYIVSAETQSGVQEVIERKETDYLNMQAKLTNAMKNQARKGNQMFTEYDENSMSGKNWQVYLGDCITMSQQVDSDSAGMCLFSPPFADMFTYSDDPRDMSNVENFDEFFEHFIHLIPELYRITMPGRVVAIHCQDVPMFSSKHGVTGLYPLHAKIIAAMVNYGFVFHAQYTIWKDAELQAIRTKSPNILHKTFAADSTKTRCGQPEYLVVFKKWTTEAHVPVLQKREIGDYIGDLPPMAQAYEQVNGSVPSYHPHDVTPDEYAYSRALWGKYASPVWFDLNESNVLNVRAAKHDKDDKHISPTNLDLLKRAIDWYTNKGETVFSPFSGIGSEGYAALLLDRKYIGIELKSEYYELSTEILSDIEFQKQQPTLFDLLDQIEAD